MPSARGEEEASTEQNCLLGAGGRWCLGFGTDAQRRSIFLRALGQGIIDARWLPPLQRPVANPGDTPADLSLPATAAVISPEHCGYARCTEWLSIRGRAAMGRIPVELARDVVQFQAEVMATAAAAASRADAERLLREGRELVRRVRDTVFMQERAVMKTGLLSCPAWQEGADGAIQGSSVQRTVRCDGFVRLLSIGGGLLPAESAKGRRYLVLRADAPVLEMYVERHPESAVPALSSLPLALFQEDHIVTHQPLRASGSGAEAIAQPSRASGGGASGASASSGRGSSSGSDIEVMKTPRGAIEAGLSAAAGLQQDDCWSGRWRFEKVEEVALEALSTWGQVTEGRAGAPDTLAVVNGAGHAFEMLLPSVAAAARWKSELLAASRGPTSSSAGGDGAGLASYLARGRRGGISGLSKSGWLWCERGKAGGGKWARRWLELDPDGELRIFDKEAAKVSEQPQRGSLGGGGSPGTVVKVNCEAVVIRSPKNVRKDHPHAFRLEAQSSSEEAGGGGGGEDLKFILEPVAPKIIPQAMAGQETVVARDEADGMALSEEAAQSAAYNAAFGVRAGKSVEEEATEWVDAIRAAGAAAAARSAQRAMALDDDIDSVLLGSIERLCEEAVLLPVLEPLLEAAATTAAPTFGNAVNFGPEFQVQWGEFGEGQMFEAGAVRWSRSRSAVEPAAAGGEQQQPPTDSHDEEDWEVLDEEATRVLEAAYSTCEGKGSTAVSLTIADDSSSSSGTRVAAVHTADFASMMLQALQQEPPTADDDAEAKDTSDQAGDQAAATATTATDEEGEPGSTSADPQAVMTPQPWRRLRRQETTLHAALRSTGLLPQDHKAFSLRPAYNSPTAWASSLRCLRRLGGGTGESAAAAAAAASAGASASAADLVCSGNLSLLPGAIEEQLVRLRDEMNAQYIAERLLPGRDPVRSSLLTVVLVVGRPYPSGRRLVFLAQRVVWCSPPACLSACLP